MCLHEVLIGTYKRPEAVSLAIESLLACDDSRFKIRCNSNGFEPSLEKYRDYDDRLIYDNFSENLGPSENWRYLLDSVESRFCMLLSDEDSVENGGLVGFLDFLESCADDVAAVSCSIFDIERQEYFFSVTESMEKYDVDLECYLVFPFVPTYMSGLTFSRKSYKDIDFDDLFFPSQGSAYTHLDMLRIMLIDGKIKFYHPRFVLKGEEARVGGDSFAHKKFREKRISDNLDLNPYVYGPEARARQYFYLRTRLHELYNHVGLMPYSAAIINLFMEMANRVLSSGEVVILSGNVRLIEYVKKAREKSIEKDEYTKGLMSSLFVLLLSTPKWFSWTVLKICKKMLKALRSWYKCSTM